MSAPFHALGARILRHGGEAPGLEAGFSIFDASGHRRVCSRSCRKTADKAHLRQAQPHLAVKNALLGPEQAAIRGGGRVRARRRKPCVDPRENPARLPGGGLRRSDPPAGESAGEQRRGAGAWQSRIWHLLVDEYQDTNRCQYRLMRLWPGRKRHSPRWATTTSRSTPGAAPTSATFRCCWRIIPKLLKIALEQNYRSTTRILQAANAR